MPWTAGVRKLVQIWSLRAKSSRARTRRNWPCGGELDGAALAAGEEALAEQGLKALDLHGDGGLGAADALGGAGEAAVLGDEDEGAEQVGVEAEGESHHQSP